MPSHPKIRMKLDRDTKERLRVAFSFCLESYKIMMGCFLSVFVTHTCEEGQDKECSILDSFRTPSATIAINGTTFAAICLLYAIELMRENWCASNIWTSTRRSLTSTSAPSPLRRSKRHC